MSKIQEHWTQICTVKWVFREGSVHEQGEEASVVVAPVTWVCDLITYHPLSLEGSFVSHLPQAVVLP